jgi:hypothetical protein
MAETDDVQQALDGQVLQQAARIADGLHRLAEEVAKVPLRASLRDTEHKDYFGFLTDVLHKMRAGNGNLIAEGLVRACQEAHAYSRGETP